MNAADELVQVEKDTLDLTQLHFFLQRTSEKQLKLLFERFRSLVLRKASSGEAGVLLEVSHQLKGISFVESKFLQIKNEQKKA